MVWDQASLCFQTKGISFVNKVIKAWDSKTEI